MDNKTKRLSIFTLSFLLGFSISTFLVVDCAKAEEPVAVEQVESPRVQGFRLNIAMHIAKDHCTRRLDGEWKEIGSNKYSCDVKSRNYKVYISTDKDQNIKVMTFNFTQERGEKIFFGEMHKFKRSQNMPVGGALEKYTSFGISSGNWVLDFSTPTKDSKRQTYTIFLYDIQHFLNSK